MEVKWEDGFEIKVTLQEQEGAVVLSANREGLRSLANILLTLADKNPGAHIHLDEYNSLEDGSYELIICQKTTAEG